ncbi:MAG: hypothetical protein KAH13_01690 [Tenericutes bacterium]|nr:hypothetical protein [Mycoplasmatota bacterium]
MSLKEEMNKEITELKQVKRPYESVAFLLFGLLVLQQVIYMFKNVITFIDKSTFVTTNGWLTSNLMGFIIRILNLGSTKWIYIILAILAFLLYYFLIYIFVWNYCKKNNLAKWTWTLFVVFCPTIFLAPAYIWFAIYVFRPHLAKFAKKFVEEFKSYKPGQEEPIEKAKAPELSKEEVI